MPESSKIETIKYFVIYQANFIKQYSKSVEKSTKILNIVFLILFRFCYIENLINEIGSYLW